MGKVTLYREADQKLLAVWYYHCPEGVQYIEEKPIEDDHTETEHQ